MSIHDGHRERMKERLLRSGLDSMNEHEILEILLFYCIPRCDTNEHAHRLINKFGSLLNVLNAPASELEKVAGIGHNSAVYLSMLGELHRCLMITKAKQLKSLKTSEEYGEYLQNYFVGLPIEAVYLLCLDARGTILACEKISEGDSNSTNVSFRKIAEISFATKAASVVLAHNHPRGFCAPSPQDEELTMEIALGLAGLDILLADHIIVSDDSYMSLAKTGIYRVSEIVNNYFRQAHHE